jgi:hypothetical protein
MVFVGLVCLTTQGLFAADLRQQVRDAASVIYVHGMTQEIADREVGPEGVPYLLELLDDPRFDRRDNVVAFLIFLGHDSESQTLASFLSKRVGNQDRPEEQRARLLVPQALAGIANRGGMVAEALLQQLAQELQAGQHQDIAPMIHYGMSLLDRVDITEDTGDGEEPAPLTDDTYNAITRHDLTYANHRDTFSKITDTRVDDLLDEATKAISFENTATDTGCCVQLTRTVPGVLFGSAGDGLDIIDTSGELTAVLSNPVSRVKVVNLINYCGGGGANIIGCAWTPGDGMAVVRLTNSLVGEALLWAHEYGHNTGLGHNPQSNHIMTSGLVLTNTRLSSFECLRLHAPMVQANADMVVFGDCHDDDNDGYQTSYDNCPYVWNFTQADNDDDGLGNECDNCQDTPNPDQADCDADDIGDACDPLSLIPGPVDQISFFDANRLIWSASEFSKNIYRGSYSGPPAPWIYNQTVVETVPPSQAQWLDPTTPDLGTINFYLITNFNGCGESD